MRRVVGTSAALIYESSVVAILRDDKPSIPYPNWWDLLGGVLEDESPVRGCQREIFEESGIVIPEMALQWHGAYELRNQPGVAYFYVARIALGMAQTMRLGDEGQLLRLMPFDEFLERDDVVPDQKLRLATYLGAEAARLSAVRYAPHTFANGLENYTLPVAN